jgi:hypothetical protein
MIGTRLAHYEVTAHLGSGGMGDVYKATDVKQRGEHLRLTREACQAFGIERKRVWQHLDGDVAIELRVARAIHLAHAAGAEGRDNFVGTETRARQHSHVRPIVTLGRPGPPAAWRGASRPGATSRPRGHGSAGYTP